MAEFELNVQDIDEIGKSHDFAITTAWLGRELAPAGVRPAADAEPGELSLRAHRQGQDIVLSGTLRASLVAECARCLEDATIEVSMRYASLLTAQSDEVRPVPDELELTPEDLDREFYSGDTIALDNSVREHLLLEVPMKPLCSPDCAGIPVPTTVAAPEELRASATGTNGVAVDPRLAPLMQLVGRLEPAEES